MVIGWSFGRGICFGPFRERLRPSLQLTTVGNDDFGQRSVFGVDGHFGNSLEDIKTGYDVSEDSVFGV